MSPLRFPDVEDTPLQRSPLVEVVCQIKFPPILRIRESPPADFQDQIRGKFSGFDEEHGIALRIDTSEGRPIVGAESAGRVYRFLSDDETKFVSLGAEFCALTHRKYATWPEFAEDLASVHGAAAEYIRPAHATRVGLRYVNVFTPDNTGITNLRGLAALLNPAASTFLVSEFWDFPSEMAYVLVLPDDDARLAVRISISPPGQPTALILDLDYFIEGKIPFASSIDRLSSFHDAIYRAFRWFVKESAIELFGPLPRSEA